jgi:hypothetical protein
MNTPQKTIATKDPVVIDLCTPTKPEILSLITPTKSANAEKKHEKVKKAKKQKPKFDSAKMSKNEKLAVRDDGVKLLCSAPCGSQLVTGKFVTGSRVGKHYLRCLKCPTFVTVKAPATIATEK